MKTRITSPFLWQGQPSEIIASNKSWHTKVTQVTRRKSTGPVVHLKGSNPPMRDNTVSAFCVATPGPADAAAQFRIKSSGARA